MIVLQGMDEVNIGRSISTSTGTMRLFVHVRPIIPTVFVQLQDVLIVQDHVHTVLEHIQLLRLRVVVQRRNNVSIRAGQQKARFDGRFPIVGPVKALGGGIDRQPRCPFEVRVHQLPLAVPIHARADDRLHDRPHHNAVDWIDDEIDRMFTGRRERRPIGSVVVHHEDVAALFVDHVQVLRQPIAGDGGRYNVIVLQHNRRVLAV